MGKLLRKNKAVFGMAYCRGRRWRGCFYCYWSIL